MEELVSGFRSGPSKKACGLQFQNRTIRTVSINWMDYSGNEETYFVLKPQGIQSVFSFEGHAWICRDAVSKKCLLLNNEEVLMPTFSETQLREGLEMFPVLKVYVSIPLFSLQDICSDLISQCISKEKDIRILEVPTTLKDLLVDCFRNVTS